MEELTAVLEARIRLIREAEREVAKVDETIRVLEMRGEGIKLELKAAISEREQRIDDLRRVINDRGVQGTLFAADGSPATAAAPATGSGAASATAPAPSVVLVMQPAALPESSEERKRVEARDVTPKPAIEDESWRVVKLDTLNLNDRQRRAFDESKLVTIGDLTDFVAKGNTIRDIPGVGEGSAKIIEQALEEFWIAWNREHGGKPTSAGSVEIPPQTIQAAQSQLADSPAIQNVADKIDAAKEAGQSPNDVATAVAAGTSTAIPPEPSSAAAETPAAASDRQPLKAQKRYYMKHRLRPGRMIVRVLLFDDNNVTVAIDDKFECTDAPQGQTKIFRRGLVTFEEIDGPKTTPF